MERLTFEGNFCEIARCKEVKCPYDTACSQKQVWERLKAYEDTGLEPEAIETVKLALAAKHMVDLETLNNTPISRLVEIAEADKDGRCVVLPCKVGDTIYAITQVFGGDGVYHKITEKKITGIGGNTMNKVWMVNRENSLEDRFSPSEFGRTVFLTREEAEKALAEMEGMKE